jgi:hypothetical protein
MSQLLRTVYTLRVGTRTWTRLSIPEIAATSLEVGVELVNSFRKGRLS